MVACVHISFHRLHVLVYKCEASNFWNLSQIDDKVGLCILIYGGCNNTMESEFSKDGAYFAILGVDGKLKIWETSTSTLKHEYTPSLHLNQPCTCLKWIQISSNQVSTMCFK